MAWIGAEAGVVVEISLGTEMAEVEGEELEYLTS